MTRRAISCRRSWRSAACGIEAGIDQQQRARANRRRRRRRARPPRRSGTRADGAGGREAPRELGQTEPQVVAEAIERDVLGLTCALPRPARIDQQGAVAAGGERTHQLHERAARADRLAGERRHDEQREGGVVWPVGVGEHGREWISGKRGRRHHRQAMGGPGLRQARTPHRMGRIHPIRPPSCDALAGAGSQAENGSGPATPAVPEPVPFRRS